MTDIVIQKGSTFSWVLRRQLEIAPLVYKSITAITKASPVAITAATHGLVTGWRAAVVGVVGMRQINAAGWKARGEPYSSDYHQVTVSDANTLAFNIISSAAYAAYTSGGSLVYHTPLSLATCTARMMIRATAAAAGDPLVSLVSPTDITLDDTNHTITVTIAAAVTATYDFVYGVYDIEHVTAGGVVTKLDSGNVTVENEVTR